LHFLPTFSSPFITILPQIEEFLDRGDFWKHTVFDQEFCVVLDKEDKKRSKGIETCESSVTFFQAGHKKSTIHISLASDFVCTTSGNLKNCIVSQTM